MYAFFKGKVESIFNDRLIIDLDNIGYEINMPENELKNINVNSQIKVYTY